jgi:3-hydroxybutyrate dehydrogenase
VRVRYDGADMSRPDAIDAMMDHALSEFGCIDLLINNAGIQHVAPVEEFPVDKWMPFWPSTCRQRSTPPGARCRR